MKFATVAVVAFLVSQICIVDTALGLGILGMLASTFAMAQSADTKKVVANFSVIHMAIGLLALSECTAIDFVANLGWHHHSLVTGGIFFVIGTAYAASGSRLARFLFENSNSKPLTCILFLTLFTFSCDLP